MQTGCQRPIKPRISAESKRNRAFTENDAHLEDGFLQHGSFADVVKCQPSRYSLTKCAGLESNSERSAGTCVLALRGIRQNGRLRLKLGFRLELRFVKLARIYVRRWLGDCWGVDIRLCSGKYEQQYHSDEAKDFDKYPACDALLFTRTSTAARAVAGFFGRLLRFHG